MKKKVAFALCTALMLCSMSVAALAAEPMTDADTVSTMISAADTLPGISAYPAEVRASEENGVYRLEKVYYLTAKDDPATIPTADFEREGHTYTLLDLLKMTRQKRTRGSISRWSRWRARPKIWRKF